MFKLLACGSEDAAQFLKPLVKTFICRILSSLESIPDIMKTVLTIAYFTIDNLFTNVVEKLTASEKTNQLARALQARFQELASYIDPDDRRLTDERVHELVFRTF